MDTIKSNAKGAARAAPFLCRRHRELALEMAMAEAYRGDRSPECPMAKQFPSIDDTLADFIGRQHIFFTASAAADTRINISPRGTDCFRVLGPNRICYLDRTGSGNETSAHLLADGRLTIMFCAVGGPPLILRLFGRGRDVHRNTSEYAALLAEHYEGREPPGARKIVVQEIDRVQTSCGYGVPLFDYREERPTLDRWAESKGEEGLIAYRREKNTLSIDGLPTGLPDEGGDAAS
jgi:hypothetical protein